MLMRQGIRWEAEQSGSIQNSKSKGFFLDIKEFVKLADITINKAVSAFLIQRCPGTDDYTDFIRICGGYAEACVP